MLIRLLYDSMVLVDEAGIARITQIHEFQVGKDGQIHANDRNQSLPVLAFLYFPLPAQSA